jgi:hypothetical protein
MKLQTPPQTVTEAEANLGFSLQVVEGILQETDGTHIFLGAPVRHQPVVVRILSLYEILLKDCDPDGRVYYSHKQFGFLTLGPPVLAVEIKTETDWFPVPPRHDDAAAFLADSEAGLSEHGRFGNAVFTVVAFKHKNAEQGAGPNERERGKAG